MDRTQEAKGSTPRSRGSGVLRVGIHVLLCLALALSACTTTSTIQTLPSGANVHVSDRYLGTSPVRVELNDGYLDDTTYYAKLSKPGYKEQEFKLEQRMRPGWITLDALLCLPTFGLGCYLIALNGKRHDKEYIIPLEPAEETAGTAK